MSRAYLVLVQETKRRGEQRFIIAAVAGMLGGSIDNLVVVDCRGRISTDSGGVLMKYSH